MLMLLVAVTTWAQTLVQITTDPSKPIYYTIYNTRSDSPGGLIYYAGDDAGLKDGCTATTLENKYKFYFTGSDDALYVHNAATTNKLASVGSWTTEGSVWCVIKRNDGNLAFGPQNADVNSNVWWNEQNQGRDGYTIWSANDAGSGFVVELASEFAYPEIGKFYTIEAPLFENVQGVAKGLVANGGNALGWNTVDLANKNFYWTLVQDGNGVLSLKNVGNGYYINGDAVREDAAALTTNVLGSNQFNIITNNVKLHAAGHDSGNGVSGGVTGWNGAANSASAWRFVERDDPNAVTTLDITYNFTYNGVSKGTQTKTVLVGQEYPNIEVAFPFGISATKPEGLVAADSETTYTIVLEENLPFKYAASFDAIENWYYVKIKNEKYLYHDASKDHIALDQATVPAAGKAAYSWAFVGNPLDGFQIVNMAAGEGYILSSSTNTADGNTGANTHPVMTATPVAEGNNELWVLTASTYQENGFYMAQKGFASNRMNNRDGKLAYWNGGADNGSTFTVELRPSSVAELTTLAAQAEALLAQITIGEAVGQYSSNYEGYAAAYAEIAAYVEGGEMEETVAEEYVITLSAIINSFSLNMPEAGKYYYLKNCNTGKYLSNVKNSTLAVTQEKGANNIFYFESDGADKYLLSYGNGNYVTNPWNIGVGAAAIPGKAEIYKQKKEFVAGNLPGAYALKYYADNGSAYYFTASGSSTNAATDGNIQANGQWTLEEVEALPVTISAAKYATFYAPVAVTVPSGVTAHTVTINGEWATLSDALTVIPANTGVVLAGEMGAYDFVITTTTATVDTDLEGTAAATYVADDAYVLGIVNDEVGFYTATKNQQSNTSWLNNSHKAYLPKPVGATAAYYSFRFGEGTTGISEVKGENGNVKTVFDLTGRRVEAITAPGIYIINGKKTLVK